MELTQLQRQNVLQAVRHLKALVSSLGTPEQERLQNFGPNKLDATLVNIVFPAAALSNAAIIELNERLDEIISTGDVSEALHMLQHVAAVFVPSDEA